MLFNGKFYNKPGHLGMTRQQLKEALAGGGGVPVKVIHIDLNEDTIAEDYDTVLSYFTDYDEGKCIVMINVGGDGYTPLRLNSTDLGGFWMEINSATGAMIVQSFVFSVDPEEKTVTLSHYSVLYTGTLEG